MKWRAPSERAQFWLAAPVALPIAAMAVPFILLGVGIHWVLMKLFPRPSEEWHPWFAWRPVSLEHWSEHVGKRGGWAWLETVERRARPYSWPTEYRSTPTAGIPDTTQDGRA